MLKRFRESNLCVDIGDRIWFDPLKSLRFFGAILESSLILKFNENCRSLILGFLPGRAVFVGTTKRVTFHQFGEVSRVPVASGAVRRCKMASVIFILIREFLLLKWSGYCSWRNKALKPIALSALALSNIERESLEPEPDQPWRFSGTKPCDCTLAFPST